MFFTPKKQQLALPSLMIIVGIFSIPIFPVHALVYQSPVFKLNITPVLLRKLCGGLITVSGPTPLGCGSTRQKGPSAVVRPAAKGLILWSKNCRLPHMFPMNVECRLRLEKTCVTKWPALHQTHGTGATFL